LVVEEGSLVGRGVTVSREPAPLALKAMAP
jgi:hypothetical protein